MIVILSAVIGATWGGLMAKRRGGNRKDLAQYAAGMGVLFAIIGLFVTIAVERSLT